MNLSSEGQKGIFFLGKRVEAKADTWKNKWNTITVYRRHDRPPSTVFTSFNLRPWWYLWLWKLPRDEKFPYSSTALVWLTDDWHLFKFLFYLSMDSIPVLIWCVLRSEYGLLGYVVMPFIRFIIFELKYKQKYE